KFSSLPNKINLDEAPSTDGASAKKLVDRGGPLKYPQLVLGMLGIFIYVGVEVTTASNLPEFMRQRLHTPTDQIAPYVSLYWASLMIGRWTASVGAFGVSKAAQKILNILMPYLAFGVFVLVNFIAGHGAVIKPLLYVFPFIIIAMIIGDVLSKGNPARQLLIFS